MSSRRLLAVLALAMVPATGSAMRVMRHVHIVAWSQDGTSALLNEADNGPEGGGSESYRVVSGAEPVDERFTLSSDFSPGGSEHPQTVSDEECVRRLDALEKLLDQKKFANILVVRAACTTAKNRRRGETVDARRTGVVRIVTRFKADGNGLVAAEWRLALKDASLVLSDASGEAVLEPMKKAVFDTLSANISPSRRLLLVFENKTGESWLDGVFASPTAKAKDFRRVGPR